MERKDARRAGDGTGAEVRSTWEDKLEAMEQELAGYGYLQQGPELELPLIIAQQLRELIHAMRPLLKHPLLRRF